MNNFKFAELERKGWGNPQRNSLHGIHLLPACLSTLISSAYIDRHFLKEYNKAEAGLHTVTAGQAII